MKTNTLRNTKLVSTRIAFGCWRLAGSEGDPTTGPDVEARGVAAVLKAHDVGYRFFDLANIYGGGRCEELFGDALNQRPGMRDEITIATKCGIRFADDPAPGSPYRYDSSREHIIGCCETSLRRMGVETIDLLMLHRPDFLADPTEIAGAFDQLKRDGKVREFGVSNYAPAQLAALQSACSVKLVCNQIEFSLAAREAITNGTLDDCIANSVVPLAWSPLAGGRLFADPSSPFATTLNDLATRHDIAPAALAVAWILRHPAGIVPIVGSMTPERIEQLAQAENIDLSHEDWYRLTVAAAGERLP